MHRNRVEVAEMVAERLRLAGLSVGVSLFLALPTVALVSGCGGRAEEEQRGGGEVYEDGDGFIFEGGDEGEEGEEGEERGGEEGEGDEDRGRASSPTRLAQASLEKAPEISLGLRYVDLVQGTGEAVKPGDRVTAVYFISLLDGTEVHGSRKAPLMRHFTVGAHEVFNDLDDGLVGMAGNGVRQIIVSPERGLGDREVGGIPANSTTVITVRVLRTER
jgi:FKBP-type peptidyl-prolyl cis-trans isomerase FkpA